MSSESIKDLLISAMKDAMRSKDVLRLSTIRMAIAAVKQKEIDGRCQLDNSDIIVVLDKLVKQRRDAAKQYHDANRVDLAEKEELEIIILQKFLPQPLAWKEVEDLIDSAILSSSAENMRDMAKVMKILKPNLQGRADLGTVSNFVREKLSSTNS